MLWDAGRNLRKHLPPTFSQYDVVRVVSILDKSSVLVDAPNCRRPPKVGDLATILEVYRDPYGFELECCDSDGFTIWLGGYSPAQLLLEPHFPQFRSQLMVRGPGMRIAIERSHALHRVPQHGFCAGAFGTPWLFGNGPSPWYNFR